MGMYRGYPRTHRLHVLIRFLTAPFTRMLPHIPAGGRLLEIGAGHGIFGYFAARDATRRVFAVEPDLRKTVHPRHAKGVTWIAGFDECVRGTFDTIALIDVTYRMPVDYRSALYRRIYDRIRPGGTFIYKDMDASVGPKMKWARFQEWLSDTFLHVSIGSGFIYQTPAEIESTLRAIGFVDIRMHRIDRGYPHPHMIVTARKP